MVETARAEEAEHILSHELSSLRILSTADRDRFRLHMNGTHLGDVLVGFNRFNVHTLVDSGTHSSSRSDTKLLRCSMSMEGPW